MHYLVFNDINDGQIMQDNSTMSNILISIFVYDASDNSFTLD